MRSMGHGVRKFKGKIKRGDMSKDILFNILFLLVAILSILLIFFAFEQDKGAELLAPTITGDIVSNLSLTKKIYTPGKSLEGTLNLRFYWSDLIPADSNITFEFSSVKCKHFYVCSDGSLVPWEVYDSNANRCKNISTWVHGPWEECGEDKYYTYPNQFSNINCTGLGGTCCNSGEGLGYYYPNLICQTGKECWGACKLTTKRKLVDFIALSTTPGKGNFTNGTYNNVNGSEPSGYGYGFSACAQGQYPPYFYPTSDVIYPISGQAISVPTPLPDLIVTEIYVKASSPSSPEISFENSDRYNYQGIKKVYAKIRNQGDAPAGAFVVLSCWYTNLIIRPSCNSQGQLPNLPPNCKVWNIPSLAPGQEAELEIKELTALYDYSIFINVDYCNSVSERDETNNEKTGYVGCKDPDLENIFLKGICTDIRGMHVDYCSSTGAEPPRGGITSVPSNTLYEYVCEPEIDRVGMVCNAKQIFCQGGCSDGKCNVVEGCTDSDGQNYFVKGTCTDGTGAYTDYCVVTPSASYLMEYICPSNAPSPLCTSIQYPCPCEEGKCIELMPDLIVTDIQRKSYDSIEGVKAIMKNIGGQVGWRSFFVKVTYKNLGWEQEYQINQSIGPNTVFTLDVRDKNISGQFVDVSVYVDSRATVEESNESNNELSKWLLPYSCENWNNVYTGELSRLGLKAPNYKGHHILNASLVYGDVVMSYYSAMFEVRTEEPKHRVCQNGQCVVVFGEGDDQCDENADCRVVCNENWQYTPWSSCIDGRKQRECYDARNCGTTFNKPASCVKIDSKYIETQSCCMPEWRCDDWSVCYNYQGETIQSMTCEDIYKCDPQNYTSLLVRNCCIEEWDCKWGPCVNGRQEKVCVDLNNCGSEFTKPEPETRSCGAEIAWWIWAIIVVVLVVILIIVLVGTNVIPLRTKPSARVEEAEVYPDLENYIKEAIAHGLSKEEIKANLTAAGWPEDVVNRTLKRY